MPEIGKIKGTLKNNYMINFKKCVAFAKNYQMCLISDLLTADIVLHEREDWMEPAVFKSIQGTE